MTDRDAVRRDPFVPPQRAMECGRSYAGKYALNHRRLNVLGANKRRWPPVLIQVGDTECLLGDSERMAESIRAAGGHCELQVWPGQVHVFPAFYPLIPEGRAAIRYVGDFVRAQTVQNRTLWPPPADTPVEIGRIRARSAYTGFSGHVRYLS